MQKEGLLVCHRIVEVDQINRTFTVKGDANQHSDPAPVPFGSVVGKVSGNVPPTGLRDQLPQEPLRVGSHHTGGPAGPGAGQREAPRQEEGRDYAFGGSEMRPSRNWILVATILLVLLIGSGNIGCVYSDSEVSAGNTATGWVPLKWTQSTAADFQASALVRTDASTSPGNVILGSSSKDAGVYALAGGTSRAFYRYNLTTSTWTAMASIPFAVGDGAALAFDQVRYVYALQGGGGSSLGRYDVILNTWAIVATAPGPVGSGGSLAWDGTGLYVMQGVGGTNIWRFNPTTAGWTTVAQTPSQVGAGASFVLSSGSLYVTRGAGTRTFWSYTLATSTWTTMARTSWTIGVGAELVAGPAGTLYETNGNGRNRFASYTISSNSWSTRATTPTNVGTGGGLAFDGTNSIYALAGGSQTGFSLFTVSTNSWVVRANLPTAVNAGGCLVYVPLIKVGYSLTGTVTSAVFDTGAAGMRLDNAFWDRTLAASTGITMEFRAADTIALLNGASFQSLGSGTSASLSAFHGRYIQWRATLTTTDAANTPTLQEVRIYYA